MLKRIAQGERTAATPVLIVHGLFGSARNWGAIQKRLAGRGRVVAVDMRNHGDSPWTASHTYPEMAADLAEVIRDEGGPMDVIGHSMGGKAAMALALTEPALVRRLVVADIAPVAYGHTQLPLVEAMRALDPGTVATRAEADRRLAVMVPDAATRAFLLQSLDLKAEPHRWRLNLPVLAAAMPDIVGFPEMAGVFEGPVLFLSGGTSGYVRPEHRDRIRALFPRARFARIKGAGHWLHAERPREFEETVRAFLA
ncbi:MAG: alpha/beta fold hydrolase [Rhodobacteraceae bacterium]|nr:alpha/beta fold hydrolase [Paracoccaceae bacterium]